MNFISIIRLQILIHISIVLNLTNAFNAFLPHRYPLFHIKDGKTKPKSFLPIRNTKLSLGVNPSHIVDQIQSFQNIHDASLVISNAADSTTTVSMGIYDILVSTFLDLGEKHTTIIPSLNELDSLMDTKIIRPDPSTLELYNASPPLPSAEYDEELKQFYARTSNFYSKLPIAALAFVVFDFFVFNAEQVRDKDLYVYDEESYMDPGLEDIPEKTVTFAARNFVRLIAGVLIVYATYFITKMTYHPTF